MYNDKIIQIHTPIYIYIISELGMTMVNEEAL